MLDTLRDRVAELAARNGIARESSAFHVGYVVGSGGQLSNVTRARAVSQASAYARMWGAGEGHHTHAHAARAADVGALLAAYGMPCVVDLLDADVQGAEYALFDEPTVRLLTSRVRRVHVGTHGHRRRNAALISMFEAHGWHTRHAYHPQAAAHGTPWGAMHVGDGVLSFVNKASLRCPPDA